MKKNKLSRTKGGGNADVFRQKTKREEEAENESIKYNSDLGRDRGTKHREQALHRKRY